MNLFHPPAAGAEYAASLEEDGQGSRDVPELRYLPRSRPCWERDADVVVVGSGAAGMSAALAAAGHGRRVLLITKESDLGGGATPLAQGGLAAAIGPGDTAAGSHRPAPAARVSR